MAICYTRRMGTQLRADGRFWLTLNGRNFLGHGRVELLQRIRETGSISKAARTMKMSYKAAWDTPLVESGPAGSRLTPDAERLITAYQQAAARHAAFMLKLAQSLPGPGT